MRSRRSIVFVLIVLFFICGFVIIDWSLDWNYVNGVSPLFETSFNRVPDDAPKNSEKPAGISTQQLQIKPLLPASLSCYNDPVSGLPNLYSQLNEQGESPIPDRSIFFHETWCFDSSDGIVLRARAACAVESAAKMNPNMTIYLLILAPGNISKSSEPLYQQLTSYENVKIRRIILRDYVKNSPVESLFTRNLLLSSGWPQIHISDIFRYLTLWKFGGIYLDLDVVVTTPLDGLDNFAGVQDEWDVASGVIGYKTTSILGRKFADESVRELSDNFKGDAWSHNGPGVITRVLAKFCNTSHTSEMNETRCQGFKVFPPSVFYPIPYPAWKDYFTPDNKNATMELIDKARAIHVWNKLSNLKQIKVGSDVPYALTAEKFCPRVYKNSGDIF